MSIPAWWSGYDGSFPFLKIGDAYPPSLDLFSLRAARRLRRRLVPLMYALALGAGCSPPSLVVASMILFDGATFVESRLILTDSILFFFELLQLWAMLKARRRRRRPPRARRDGGGGESAAAADDDEQPRRRRRAEWHAATAAAAAAAAAPAVWRWLLVTGVGIGGAISTKHTGFGTMAIVGLESIRSLVVTLVHCVLVAPPAVEARRRRRHAAAAAGGARGSRRCARCSSSFARASRRCSSCPPPPTSSRSSSTCGCCPTCRPATRRRSASTRAVHLPDAQPGRRDDADRAGQSLRPRWVRRCEGVEPLSLLRAIWVLNKRCSARTRGSRHHDGSGWLHCCSASRPSTTGRAAAALVPARRGVQGVHGQPRGVARRHRRRRRPRLLLLAGLLNAINGAEVRHPSARQRARRCAPRQRLAAGGWVPHRVAPVRVGRARRLPLPLHPTAPPLDARHWPRVRSAHRPRRARRPARRAPHAARRPRDGLGGDLPRVVRALRAAGHRLARAREQADALWAIDGSSWSL